MRIRHLILAFLIGAAAAPVAAQDAVPPPPPPVIVPLWPAGAPGSEAHRTEPEQAQDYWVRNVHNPSLTVFPADPQHRNGAAVIVLPGGAHRFLVYTTEGTATALPLNRMGVTAFVLKYRLAKTPGSPYSIADSVADVQRAIRWVRAHAADYDIDPHRVGIMGFSAGGELVTLVADNPQPAAAGAADEIDRQSARPDFQILVFPGPMGLPAKAIEQAPPAFITAGSIDKCCAAPSVQLYEQLRKAGVPAELHMYANADHAFNLGETTNLLSIIHWPDRLADWLADGGWLDATSRHQGK
jgi:acetyl esterase/lipase